MPPHPHGPGFAGASHSHDPEFPDDNFNLYSNLDPDTTTALNVTRQDQSIGVFKPFARRLEPEPKLLSDADQEVIVIARFTSPVHIRKLMIIGGGEHAQHPASLRCFVNKDGVDFTSVGSMSPAQVFTLPINENGTIELTTALQPFTNVMTCAFYFPENHGSDTTVLQYIGMQGEHTHYRREAVDTVYEVLCTGQETGSVEEEALGNMTTAKHKHFH